MTIERWSPYIIDNKYSRYEISTKGRVKNIDGYILSPRIKNSGYYYVILHHKRKRLTRYVHRLVAQTFYPVSHIDEIWVNHKDGNKLNNEKSNIEWVTPSYNTIHAISNNLTKNKGETSTLGKFTDNEIHNVCKMIVEGKTVKEICNLCNMSRTHVIDIKYCRIRKDIAEQYGFVDIKHKINRIDIELKRKVIHLIEIGKSNNEIIRLLNLQKNNSTKNLLAKCRKVQKSS